MLKKCIQITAQCTSDLTQIKKIINKNGFIMNPYESCMAKKLVMGEAMTVPWGVDDLKVSHKGPF